MKIVKNRILMIFFFFLIGISCDMHTIGGPQIRTYDTILKNIFQQAASSIQNFFSYIASSVGTAIKTSSPSSDTIAAISKPQGIATWVILTGAVLLATTIQLKTSALRKLLAYIHSPFNKTSSQGKQFSELPLDMQRAIIALLSLNSNAKSLKDATQTIKVLSETNKALNQLINEPRFCLKIIQSLGQQFYCADEQVARALLIKASKDCFELQTQLKNLCTAPVAGDEEDVSTFRTIRKQQLIDLCDKGASLSFSYGDMIPVTPLILALEKKHYFLAETLLDKGSEINQNIVAPSYSSKNTALIYFTNLYNRIPDNRIIYFKALEFLLNQKNISIDQVVAPHNNTALILLAGEEKVETVLLQMLLDAGANPTKMNNEGQSAESLISNAEEPLPNQQKLLDLIEEAKRAKRWELPK